MARLIDADAFYKRYCEVYEDGVDEGEIARIAYMISIEPTAYDVEKVVEQMADLNTFNLNLADKMLDIQKSGKAHRHYVCVEDAIEIVRKGEVE